MIGLAKSSSAVLAAWLGEDKLSTRNRLERRVRSVTLGAVNTKVVVDAADLSVVVLVKQSGLADFALVPSAPELVLVKVSNILVTVASQNKNPRQSHTLRGFVISRQAV